MRQRASVQEMLGLRTPPIAMGFFTVPPNGLSRWGGGPQPSSCSFWRLAQTGQAFFTTQEDHYGCAIGAYIHHIDLPADRASELDSTLARMTATAYIEPSEIGDIPRLARPPAIVAYGPVEAVEFPPAIVMVSAKPAQAMLLYEAALRTGAGTLMTNLVGRPGCAFVPFTLDEGAAILSFGCAGSRLHTETPDDELYVSIPGEHWQAVAENLTTIQQANGAMVEFYEERRR